MGRFLFPVPKKFARRGWRAKGKARENSVLHHCLGLNLAKGIGDYEEKIYTGTGSADFSGYAGFPAELSGE